LPNYEACGVIVNAIKNEHNVDNSYVTAVRDANGKITSSYKDIRGRQTAVKAPGEVWTSFVYNPIGELLEATDDEGNTTFSKYDDLGRRLSRNHPDAGLTEYTYDAAGNMRKQVTANLRETNQEIVYTYDYNRPTGIEYPQNTINNVKYEYGEPGADFNRAGRVVLQEDATGAQEFFYGPLGEVVKNIRTIIVPEEGIYTFETKWEYDTWNRLKHMTYPDGEELTYNYNAGGLLLSMQGNKKGHLYDYLSQIGYDKFEDRKYISYGNGTETTYEYESDRRRLHHIEALTSAGRKMMDNTYIYDKVNNITGLKSEAPIPSADLKGGRFEYNYEYDDLYRLTDATGHYEGATHEHEYTLSMDYSTTGRILHKGQEHIRRGYDEVDWAPRHKTTYDWEYRYEGEKPHAPSQIGENTYAYDANGNTTGWKSTKNNQRRDILWDEENRMRAIADNGVAHHYMYDASGQRVIKATGDGQAVYVNGFPMAGSGTVGNYTMYVNPFMVVSNMKFTKHFYIEGQRIVSKIGEMGEYKDMLNPKDTLKAGGDKVNWDKKKDNQKAQLIANFEALGLDGALFTAGKSGKVPYGRIKKYFRENDGLVNGGDRPANMDTISTGGNKPEKLQFYYHPDHLGSSSYITDISGEVYQHMEYFPFGETFIEERTDAAYTSYLFNGKELDEETGLYYYGARYYDPRISMWYGVDPLAEKYSNVSAYVYVANNPVKLIDPDGMQIDGYTVDKKGQVEYLNDDGGNQFDVLYSKEDQSKPGIVIRDKNILPKLSETQEITKADGYDTETGETLMETYDVSLFSTSDGNKNEMLKLFFFLAENSNRAEWRMHETKDGKFGIGTYHASQDSPTDDDFGLKAINIKMMIHSHPRPSTKEAAEKGFDYDMNAAKHYETFYIYVPKIGYIYKLPQDGSTIKRMKK
jgi:RHS repeat-associated protein